jgi:hypothetical protein
MKISKKLFVPLRSNALRGAVEPQEEIELKN